MIGQLRDQSNVVVSELRTYGDVLDADSRLTAEGDRP